MTSNSCSLDEFPKCHILEIMTPQTLAQLYLGSGQCVFDNPVNKLLFQFQQAADYNTVARKSARNLSQSGPAVVDQDTPDGEQPPIKL